MANSDNSSRDSLDSTSSHDPVKAVWQMELDDPRSANSHKSRSFLGRFGRALIPRWAGASRSHDYYAAPTDESGTTSMNGPAKRSPPASANARMLHFLKRLIYKIPLLVLLFL